MDWQKELIVSHDKTVVEEFLEKHLESLGVAQPRVSVSSSRKDFNVEINDGLGREICFLLMRGCENKGFAIDDIRVHDTFRGQSIGPLVVKAGLGAASARGKTHLMIDNIGEDGLIFWHKLGAVHYICDGLMRSFGESVEEVFKSFLTIQRKELAFSSQIALMTLVKSVKRHPLSTLRLLANADIKTKFGEQVTRDILAAVPGERRRILLPGEPTTRVFLQKKLGTIPDFEDVSGSYRDFQKGVGFSAAKKKNHRSKLALG